MAKKPPKKYCECCEIFVQNNPVSLNKHFSGNRHKRNLQKSVSNKRKEKSNQLREDRDAMREIRQLEMVCSKRNAPKKRLTFVSKQKAAKQSLVKDVKNGFASCKELERANLMRAKNRSFQPRNESNNKNWEQRGERQLSNFRNNDNLSNENKERDNNQEDFEKEQVTENVSIEYNVNVEMPIPTPPVPQIPEGMSDPQEIENFYKSYFEEFFKQSLLQTNSSNQEDQEKQNLKESYVNRIETDQITENPVGFGEWKTVERTLQKEKENCEREGEREEKGEDWIKQEKWDEEAEEDVEEQMDRNQNLNLPSDDSEEDSENQANAKKKGGESLFKRKKFFNSSVSNKKFKKERD